MADASKVTRNPLLTLHDLGRAARRAESQQELEFLIVNDTRTLSPYRQAALWVRSGGVRRLSGVVKVEANVPYVQWLNKIASDLALRGSEPRLVTASDFDQELASVWSDWLPTYALWIPLQSNNSHSVSQKSAKSNEQPAPKNGDGEADPILPADAGILFARDLPWTEAQITLIAEWVDVWFFSWKQHKKSAFHFWKFGSAKTFSVQKRRAWWKSRSLLWLVALLVLALIPVRLTVLAPGELVPANPAVLRAPLDGVIETFHVQPNELVTKGQLLLSFDESLLQSRLDVTRQALATAEVEYRQTEQLALRDPRAKLELSALAGQIAERRAELGYVEQQFMRTQLLAPQDGIVLFDDPSEWIGRPVRVGERIMSVARLDDVEIEAWISVSDAIPVEDKASVKLFLSANPIAPVDAQLRYIAYDAVQRPDMSYAYRLRAGLKAATEHRVGMKGTAKLFGRKVPLAYWVFRRPIASLRTAIGW